jgi:hypothetical protein
MRRSLASLLLLVVALAVFTPLAQATVLRNAHACCFKRHHGAAPAVTRSGGDPAQHACCGAATVLVATPALPAAATQPLAVHALAAELARTAGFFGHLSRPSGRAPPRTSSR